MRTFCSLLISSLSMADQTISPINDSVNVNDTTVHEWEAGLPYGDELTPLSQLMLPPQLASAFSISPEPLRNSSEVTRASNATISSLRVGSGGSGGSPLSDEEDQDSEKLRKIDDAVGDVAVSEEEHQGRSKRQRLVWTPQLHKRFVDVVGVLGMKNAVPKTIMQMMNVEGLTRENVASHLQKYRLYLKRMHDGSGTSATTPAMATTVSESEMQGMGGLPYAAQPMPVYGVGGYHMMMPQQQQQQQQQMDWGRSN